MIVNFVHGSRRLGHRVMDAVPRAGDVVSLDGAEYMTVREVVWELHGGEQAAWVLLKDQQEIDRELYGRQS